MNTEEEFYLGNSSDDSEFFMGNSDDDFYLGDTTIANNEPASDDDKAYQELLEIYELLKIGSKPYKVEFEEYFKDNPEIFKVADTKYFKTLSENEYKSFENKCDKLVAIAHKKWIKIENQRKLEDLEKALNTLKSIFRQPAKTEAYIEEIKRTLKAHLNAALRQKIKNGILEVSEIQEIMEIAVSIRLISDSEAGHISILNSIRGANERKLFKIESFEETFVRIVSGKPKIERMDTDSIRENLFKEYKSLSDISDYVLANQSTKTDEELFEDMCQLLSDNNLLISNIELFMIDFLEIEIEKKGDFYFSVPLNNDYYYYLKGTAVNKYELTEDQWRQITMIRNIRNESDFTVAFIMGHKKESSVVGISKLLQENPETSFSRILAGDLETYFTHIGRKNIANKISKLKDAYRTNQHELVIGVVNLLNSEIGNPIDELTTSDNKEKLSLDSLLKEDAGIKELVSFVVKHKEDEKLYSELSSESITVERVQALLISKTKKYSYTKFLLNILNELLLENDISEYKYAFIKIAIKIQEILNDKEDFATFIKVYVPIVRIAIDNNIINNSDEISGYSEIKEMMNQKYNIDYEMHNNNAKKKSIFGLFKKGE
ncbi:MAG: hypothetical protein MR555_03490 [Spirochaetia bacterium]|nr:hypothetical protein [Spirochaetia bacterium]